jgi:hypothetical protein
MESRPQTKPCRGILCQGKQQPLSMFRGKKGWICIACKQHRLRGWEATRREEEPERDKRKAATYYDRNREWKIKQSKRAGKRRRQNYDLDPKPFLRAMLSAAGARAHMRDMPYDLTWEWLWERYQQQEGKCLLTGIPFAMAEEAKYKKNRSPYSPSLDRIDSSQGYTQTNTRLVCHAVNIAMNCFGYEVFMQVVRGLITVAESSQGE